MNKNTRTLFGFFLTSLISTSASAALYDRGNGMIYDSTQNITWLQDFNYASTSGFNDPTDVEGDFSGTGIMIWESASAWADSLSYAGHSDWRLPHAGLIGDLSMSFDGSTDYSFNNIRSELGYLFFEELIHDSSYDQHGNYNPLFNGLTNTGPFQNMQNYPYWLSDGWAFSFDQGLQLPDEGFHFYAVAVRDGDVLAVNEVPVPAAAWLLGSGLIGLAAIKRRKQ